MQLTILIGPSLSGKLTTENKRILTMYRQK